MPFEILPAIDLLGGQAVRLSQGRYDAATVYDPDPAAVAARFAAAGSGEQRVRWIHVVDLDGAKDGRPGNAEAVQAILKQTDGLHVELGGGIRSIESVERWLQLGVSRVILGTVALTDPALVREAARLYPGRVAVGIDARDGRVAVEGWLETSDTTAIELAKRFQDAGVAAIIHTDIARDGMGTGPNLAATGELAQEISIPVIASGGVGSNTDVENAASQPGIAGLIIGRALYEGHVELERALEIAGEASCS